MGNILITKTFDDYELLDSGDGEKLERYGGMVLSRPDPQVLWAKSLPKTEWGKADAVFLRTGTSGKWKFSEKTSKSWQVSLNNIKFNLELLPSKHLGVFPEQSVQWEWLEGKIKNHISSKKVNSEDGGKATAVSVLNLFGYTGGATLACAKAGASVCHVDASKFAVDLANKNMKSSGLSDKPIRFIVDDVRKFVEREIKRGNKYDVILMDPPVYGKGVKGEVWKIEKDLVPLVSRLKLLLSSSPVAIVLNGYASVYSSSTYAQILSYLIPDIGGEMSFGELGIKESSGGRVLTCGIFARWSK